MKEFRIPLYVAEKIIVHGCCLGEKIGKNPLKDVTLHLVIDDFKAELNPEYKNIIVWIKKAHIEKHAILYCSECLTNGVKNADLSQRDYTGKTGLCLDHYASKVRRENPDLACPWCENGFIMFGMGNGCCSHCNYTEPHVHDQPCPKPIMLEPSEIVMETPMFACTCMSWNTPTEHSVMRKKIAELKEEFIQDVKEGDYVD